MNTGIKYLLVCVLSLLSSTDLHAGSLDKVDSSDKKTRDIARLEKEAALKIDAFSSLLKQTLQTAIKEGGPTSAISACKDKAPAIANSMTSNGWQFKRSSLRTRNPNNAPDDWERAMLEKFEQQKKRGLGIENLVVGEFNDGRFRYIKAISTDPLCLICHGENIAPNIKMAIDHAYPQDKAKGFRLGDIRGAFSLTHSD